ncbi:MAG: divalent-cation tolerance protein CutA [Acidobacteria bacterium]|nr:MAG: divalent-cation tolerance protein CutA [Acidobacteriota bacterium]
MTDKRLIMTTASSRDEANTIASELVSRHLAACVNILGPISSVYRWKGEVESSEEFLLLIKSTEAQSIPIQAAIREIHSYEVPELISFTIESGSDSYLNWIAASVR